ncbi:MAG: GNAT family N-acetyltransferase [Alistipes sp.]|nr:GNAT family N-acetyltransferase [Alistipes sp.]
MNIERLANPTAPELDALTDLWEVSVRATHDFLAPEDIPLYRRLVRKEALPAATLYVLRDNDGSFAAFAGTEGDKLEMLFVAPTQFGRGLGSKLANYVATHCGVRRVDVNEQNEQAAKFYARLGFRIVARDACDPSGKSYPILHLER